RTTSWPYSSRASVPALRRHSCAPRRMVPPRSERSVRCSVSPVAVVHSVISAMTGSGVLRSFSLEAGRVAGELDHGSMHAVADAEVRDAGFTGELRREDLALEAALAEAARHQDGVGIAE